MRDEWFIRGEAPMTKREVRAISIERLELYSGAVLYDVGAGTGAVCVEAAAQVGDGVVYAIEKKREAVKLLEKNKERFGASQIHIIEGEAPEAFLGLKRPTHAFLGGTSGKMEEILNGLLDKNPDIRIVINAITLESVWAAQGFTSLRGIEAELIQVQVSKARSVGKVHMMMGQNPIWILAFGDPDVEEGRWGGDEG